MTGQWSPCSIQWTVQFIVLYEVTEDKNIGMRQRYSEVANLLESTSIVQEGWVTNILKNCALAWKTSKIQLSFQRQTLCKYIVVSRISN